MPIYEYKCTCGKRFTRYLPLSDYRKPQSCSCGQVAEKCLSAPAVRADYPGYQCPVTGDWIEGRRAHEENLKKHNCRVLEPGETEAFKRRRVSEDTALEDKIADSAAEFVETLPTAKREQLGRELEHGADITVVRQ